MNKDKPEIELSSDQVKKAISSLKLKGNVKKWRSNQNQHLNHPCGNCSQHFSGNMYHVPSMGWICTPCWNKNQRSVPMTQANVTRIINSLINQTKSSRSSSTAAQTKKNNTIEAKAQPYISSGLAEPFALAIARGVDHGQVLNLWEADWWKQYPAEDILICAVLDGELSEEDGRWLNDIRSDHERLAITCVEKGVTIEWAKALLEAGFDAHPEAVPDVLEGGDPAIISRIRGMKVDGDLLPPSLSGPIKKRTVGGANRKTGGVKKETRSWVSEDDLESMGANKLKQLCKNMKVTYGNQNIACGSILNVKNTLSSELPIKPATRTTGKLYFQKIIANCEITGMKTASMELQHKHLMSCVNLLTKK